MKKFLIGLLIFQFLSCTDSISEFDDYPTDGVLILTPDKSTVIANGFDVVNLLVTIDKKTDADKREVIFTTTLGTFVETQTKEMKVTADAQGQARATLLAPITQGAAYVTAKAGTYARTQTINFQSADPANIINLAGPTNKKADGRDTARFTIAVPPALYQQSISVKVTKGIIINSNATTLTAKPNGNGVLLLTLQAPTTPGVGYLTVTVGSFERVHEINFSPVNATEILNLQVPITANADGASVVEITMQVPPNSDISQSVVALSTTAGGLLPSGGSTVNVKPDVTGKVVVQLKAPAEPGTAFITAEVLSIRQTASVVFHRAYPERIELDPGAFVLKASNTESVNVEARLLRSVGIPSRDTEVEFGLFDETGTTKLSMGQFRSITRSNTNGVAIAQFTFGSSTYRGRVLIRASVNTPGGIIRGEKAIVIIDP